MKGEQVLELVVFGEPEPQGSVRAFVPTTKNGQPARRPGGSIIVNLTSDNKDLKKWRELCAGAARERLVSSGVALGDGHFPLEGCGFTVELESRFKRPEGHYGTGRNAGALKDQAPARPIGSPPMAPPDVDKLLRAMLDAMTGVVWRDDSQVTDARTVKTYAVATEHGPGLGCVLRVWLNAEQVGADLAEDERVRWVPPPEGQAVLAV